MSENDTLLTLGRIKFETRFMGIVNVEKKLRGWNIEKDVFALARLLFVLERHGAMPVLIDGFVGGNCAIRIDSSTLVVTKSKKMRGKRLDLARDLVVVKDFDVKVSHLIFFFFCLMR